MGKTIDKISDIGRIGLFGGLLAVYGTALLSNKVIRESKKGFYRILGIDYSIVESQEDDLFEYCVRKKNS